MNSVLLATFGLAFAVAVAFSIGASVEALDAFKALVAAFAVR